MYCLITSYCYSRTLYRYTLRTLVTVVVFPHRIEDALRAGDAVRAVENASAIARLASRVAQVAKQEADNSEDHEYIAKLVDAAERLQAGKELTLTVDNLIDRPIKSFNWCGVNKSSV